MVPSGHRFADLRKAFGFVSFSFWRRIVLVVYAPDNWSAAECDSTSRSTRTNHALRLVFDTLGAPASLPACCGGGQKSSPARMPALPVRFTERRNAIGVDLIGAEKERSFHFF